MKTLHPELQALLDRMIDHLATQQGRAFNEERGMCAYRTDDGQMCAVGCLIPTELYHPDLEGPVFNMISAPDYHLESDNDPRVPAGKHLRALAPSIGPGSLSDFLDAVQAYHDHGNYNVAINEAAPGELRERIALDLNTIVHRRDREDWSV